MTAAPSLIFPDVVMACCGDIPTMESLAATAILREEFPYLKVRFINVVDLFKLVSEGEHPHGLKRLGLQLPVHHGQAGNLQLPRLSLADSLSWCIAARTRTASMCGVTRKRGNINTPLELAILNQIDRFNLVIDVIDRVPKLGSAGGSREGKDEEQHHQVPHTTPTSTAPTRIRSPTGSGPY